MYSFEVVSEVAVAILGFTGVVVAFKPALVRSGNSDQGRVGVMTRYAMMAFVYGLLPDVLRGLQLREDTVWLIAAIILGLSMVVQLSFVVREHHRIPEASRSSNIAVYGTLIPYVLLALALIAAPFSIWRDSIPGMYLMGLLYSLVIALSAFVNLLFREQSDGDVSPG